jgi:hypothetical protein
MRWNFVNLLNPFSRTMALESTQPLTEMSTRKLPGCKKRPARRADNLAVFYEPNVWKCGSLNLPQPSGPPRPVWGSFTLPYLTYMSVYTHSHTHTNMVSQNSVTTRLMLFPLLGVVSIGRAIAQAVSRRFPTAAARVRAQIRSCGICGGQSGTGADFPRVFWFPCQFSFHRLLVQKVK